MNSSERQMVFDPPSLDFHEIPMFGETVFRLKCASHDPPRLAVRHSDAVWATHAMVRNGVNAFCLALRLSPGKYYYYFVDGERPLLDPCNTGAIAVEDGRPISTLIVPDRQALVKISNLSETTAQGKLIAASDQIDITPSIVRVPARGHVLVSVLPNLDQPFPGLVATGIAFNMEPNDRTTAYCPVQVQRNANVPFMSSLQTLRGKRSSWWMKLQLTCLGPGKINCKILDRVAARIRVIEFDNGEEWGCSTCTHQVKIQGANLIELFRRHPAVTVMSDSPFPDQRILEFTLRDKAEAEHEK